MIPSIPELVSRGALFAVNHSAGKDSQAMFIEVSKQVPKEQLVVVHAALGDIEWPGTIEHIKATIGDAPFVVANATKTFFDMVEHRKMFPSPANRQCTSDLKRGPIEREIRRYLKENLQYKGVVVNCMGMRADESSGRSKLATFKKNEGNSKAGREWYDWLPIHERTVSDVFGVIRDAGQEPHWAYAAGMTRLSCCFCIMASKEDLTTAAKFAAVFITKIRGNRNATRVYAQHVAQVSARNNRSKMTNIIVIAFTLWLECESESFNGKAHGATVIYNMAQKYNISAKAACLRPQWFSSWNKDDPRDKGEVMRRVAGDPEGWKSCLSLAMEIDAGTFTPLSRANHFWKVGTHPWWAKDCINVYRIDNHYFGYEP